MPCRSPDSSRDRVCLCVPRQPCTGTARPYRLQYGLIPVFECTLPFSQSVGVTCALVSRHAGVFVRYKYAAVSTAICVYRVHTRVQYKNTNDARCSATAVAAVTALDTIQAPHYGMRYGTVIKHLTGSSSRGTHSHPESLRTCRTPCDPPCSACTVASAPLGPTAWEGCSPLRPRSSPPRRRAEHSASLGSPACWQVASRRRRAVAARSACDPSRPQ